MGSTTLDRLLTTLAVRIHAFAICEIKAGWQLELNPTEAVEIHYVLAGNGVLRSNGGVETAYKPFSIIIVPPNSIQILGEAGDVKIGRAVGREHCGPVADRLIKFTTGAGKWDTLIACATISASYGGALGLFDNLCSPVVEDLSQDDKMRGMFAVMLAEIADEGIGTQALIEAIMKQCLILLLRRHLTELDVRSPFFAVLGDRKLTCAVASVLERPSATHTVDSLASTAGMSRSRFSASFTKTFQQTPIGFVQQVRLRLGADLLRTTDLPINLIASTVGYTSRSYFTRAFRAAYAKDPKSFRASAARSDQAVRVASSPGIAELTAGGGESTLEERAKP